ncbi:hypothetical protein Tco_0038874 [Tanacetum coccineum]
MEMLQARENLMEAIQALLKKYNQIPSEDKCIALWRAEQKFLKVKQAFEEDQSQPEIIQELLLQLIHDLQRLDEILPKQAEEKGINTQVQKKQEEKSIAELLAEEQAAAVNSLYQNPDLLQSFIYQDDDNDDDDYDEESIISMNADMSETPSPDAITTSSPIEEPKDSLIMEDEDIDTIPEKESDEENESSVENLFHIPSESEATSNNESECDLPNFNDSPLDVFKDNCVISSRPLFDSYGDTTSSEYSSDDESILKEDVFSNLPFKFDVESISSDVYLIFNEVLEDIDSTNYIIDSINNFSPKIDPLLEEFAGELALINPIPLGIARAYFDPEGDSHIIEFFSAFPIPVEGSDFIFEETNAILSYLDDSLLELETFSFHIEEKNSVNTTTHFDYSLPIYEKFSFHDDPPKEKNSDSTTTHADISLPKYDSFYFDLSDTSLQLADKSDSVFEKFDDEFAHIISPPEYDCYYFDIEPDLGELTRVVVEDIFGEPRVHMPDVLPTLCQDLNFTLSTDFSGSDHVVSFPFGNRNKTFDPGISIEVQSKRFLSLNTFSISFISDPLSPVLETLLPFSSKNEDKVFNPGILVSKEEKSPHLLSHRGFKAFKIIHNFLNESPMMIYGGDIPIWDVPQLSAKDKTGLGYGDQLNENDSSGSEMFNSVFDSRSFDGDDNQTNDRPTSKSNKTSANKPSFKRIEFTNAWNESIKPTQTEKPRIITRNSKVDRRNWNGKMTQKLGLGFGFTKKACFVCGSYSHLIKDCDFYEKRMAKKSILKNIGKNTGQREIRPVWNSAQRINHQNKFVPSAVLTRFRRVPISAAKQSSLRATTSTSTFRPVNTATYTNRVNVSKLRTNAFHKSYSPIRRPFYKSTAPNTRILNEKVNTVRVNGVNTAGQIAVSAVKGTGVTAGNPQQALKNKGIFDSGCSRHMTGNKDFLTDYQDIDGGFVAFGGSARGGKITGKGKIRTDKLDFEDVFFVKELKFNLFSVSQMCDKKNSVLFTKTECLVLSPDFKLLDESQVLLRVPRQSNMYSFDLRNVVLSRDLSYLFANAIIDESKLWHMRMV